MLNERQAGRRWIKQAADRQGARAAAAVEKLLVLGADPRRPNGRGSTPLHLAVQNTGASGSGEPEAHERQLAIVSLLLRYGAVPSDKDRNGKSVIQAARQGTIYEILARQTG